MKSNMRCYVGGLWQSVYSKNMLYEWTLQLTAQYRALKKKRMTQMEYSIKRSKREKKLGNENLVRWKNLIEIEARAKHLLNAFSLSALSFFLSVWMRRAVHDIVSFPLCFDASRKVVLLTLKTFILGKCMRLCVRALAALRIEANFPLILGENNKHKIVPK